MWPSSIILYKVTVFREASHCHKACCSHDLSCQLVLQSRIHTLDKLQASNDDRPGLGCASSTWPILRLGISRCVLLTRRHPWLCFVGCFLETMRLLGWCYPDFGNVMKGCSTPRGVMELLNWVPKLTMDNGSHE